MVVAFFFSKKKKKGRASLFFFFFFLREEDYEMAQGLGTQCRNCDPSRCTYPEHVLFQTPSNKAILGAGQKLCEGIYHVFPAKEYGLPNHGCIDGNPHDGCRPQALTLVAVCGHLVARFTNCKRKHAEEFLVTNRTFFDFVRSGKAKAMVLFMKHHPCHFSSGNARTFPAGYLFEGKPDTRSCTNQIIRYFNTVLQPHGVSLTIVVAGLYKSFWQYATRPDDQLTSRNSLLGLKLLLGAGINVRGFRFNEWIMLANLCSEPLSLKHLFSAERCCQDTNTQQFIDKTKLELKEEETKAEKDDDEVVLHLQKRVKTN